MKLYIKGGGTVSLTQANFVASGGQGSVYAKNGMAYKVYTDPAAMLPVGKIQELSVLTRPGFIKPEQVLCNKQGKPLGYTMRFVQGGISLCEMFPPVFRDREGLDHKQAAALVRKLQESVAFAHSVGILLIDINEQNFLLPRRYDDVLCIDTDSYQTPHFPATVLMESVRDWHSKKFTELTDWFSFGVLAFQMFTGVHPYRGRYKGVEDKFKQKLPTDAPDDSFAVTRRRMQGNISVFNSEVGVPKAVYPFTVIPDPYRAWFQAMFEQGKRANPPGDFGAAVILVPTIRTIQGTGNLDIHKIGNFEGTIQGIWSQFGNLVVTTNKGIWLDGHRVGTGGACAVGFTLTRNRPVSVTPADIPKLWNLVDRVPVNFGMRASEIMSYDGRMYLKSLDKILEVSLADMGNQIVATTRVVSNVLEHATKLYDGCALQNLLGSLYVSMFPQAGQSRQIHLKELDKYRVVDARFDSGVLMAVGEKKGQYDRLVFRFTPDYQSYDVRKVEGISPSGLNFVTLDSGICVCLNEDEKLEVFKAKKGSAQMKVIEDKVLGSDMRLAKQGARVLFFRGSTLYTMKMK